MDFGPLCSSSSCEAPSATIWVLDLGFRIWDFVCNFFFVQILDFGFRILDFVPRFGPTLDKCYWARRPGSADLEILGVG